MSDYDPENLLRTPEVRSDELMRGTLGGYMRGVAAMSCLRSAVKFDLFRYTESPKTAKELSVSMSTNLDLTEMLCDSLAQLGFLDKKDGKYVNSAVSSMYLDPRSPAYQEHGLESIFKRMDRWSELDERLRNGPHYRPRDDVMGESWLKAIGESCMGGGIGYVVEAIDEYVDLGKYGTFMDLAGGHGLYTIAICHKHPNLKGYVFDQPMMKEIAEENFRRYGKDIQYISGDFYKDDMGGPYDVVFSSFNLSTSDMRMCDRVYNIVKKGGLLILRRHLPITSTDSLSNLDWSLDTWDGKGKKNYGGSWLPTSEEYIGHLKELGMVIIHRGDLDKGSELVILRK